MAELRILAVAPYVPFEGILHAGGEYLLRHLHRLSQVAQVTLLVPGSDAALADAERAPEWLRLVVPPIDLVGRSTTRRLGDAAYRRLMAAPPMPTAESLRAVRDGGLLELAGSSDVVELHWPEYARFARELRRAGVSTPVSVVEHDVDVRGALRRVRTRARGYRIALGVATSPVARRLELQGLRSADLICVFKAADEQLLRELGIRATVRVLDPWLEEPGGADGVRERGRVLFTGAMWRPENALGAAWLLREVWPSVRAQVPEAALTLAGDGPDENMRSLAEQVGGVEVTGRVPSLLPYYQRAAVFVAPLFSGGGLKFKVPQAMLCGLPVVGTAVALEGVVEQAPAEALWGRTDEPAEMAALLVAALRERDRAAAVGAAAARWAAGRYSFERALDVVLDDYAELAARSGSGRASP